MATETVTRDLFADYAAWKAEREALSAREDSGDPPSANEWHYSDDNAIGLLHAAMAALGMAALELRPKPEPERKLVKIINGEVRCPTCGGLDLHFSETVLDWRDVDFDLAEKRMTIGDSNFGDGEVEDGLQCNACMAVLDLPEGWDEDYG